MIQKKSDLETHVFIDVSNIRSACLTTLGLKIDFCKLFVYFDRKYPNLKGVHYYEGIAKGDAKKAHEFAQLEQVGYKVHSLERKTYVEPPVYKEIKCKKCKTVRRVQILGKATKMKSNVDVYLATDLLRLAYLATKPTRIILVACDGDYAEMIKSALTSNKNIQITVIATPVVPLVKLSNGKTKNINSCSTRLQKLKGNEYPNFHLTDIRDIRDYIQ